MVWDFAESCISSDYKYLFIPLITEAVFFKVSICNWDVILWIKCRSNQLCNLHSHVYDDDNVDGNPSESVL